MELASYRTLQDLLTRPEMLIYFNPKYNLYTDFDSFKQFSFSAIAYYVRDGDILEKSDAKNRYSFKNRIQPIFFLSHLFIFIKSNYWITELEVVDFI